MLENKPAVSQSVIRRGWRDPGVDTKCPNTQLHQALKRHNNLLAQPFGSFWWWWSTASQLLVLPVRSQCGQEVRCSAVRCGRCVAELCAVVRIVLLPLPLDSRHNDTSLCARATQAHHLWPAPLLQYEYNEPVRLGRTQKSSVGWQGAGPAQALALLRPTPYFHIAQFARSQLIIASSVCVLNDTHKQ